MMQPRTCPTCGRRYMADADNGQAVVGHQCRDDLEVEEALPVVAPDRRMDALIEEEYTPEVWDRLERA